ncbi:hypothetical protein QQ045_002436 [Rhodiola kirilowii]
MADQPVPRAAILAALATQMAAMSTQLAELRAKFNQNVEEERAQREAPVSVSRGRSNCVEVAENSSLAEEDPEEEIELKKKDIIVAEEALEEIDELAMLRILADDFEEEYANGKIGVKLQVLIEDCSDMCYFLNAPVPWSLATFNILKDVKPKVRYKLAELLDESIFMPIFVYKNLEVKITRQHDLRVVSSDSASAQPTPIMNKQRSASYPQTEKDSTINFGIEPWRTWKGFRGRRARSLNLQKNKEASGLYNSSRLLPEMRSQIQSQSAQLQQQLGINQQQRDMQQRPQPASTLMQPHNIRDQQDLINELIRAKRLLEFAPVMHPQAEGNQVTTDVVAKQRSTKLKEVEDEFKLFAEQIMSPRDLQSKLDVANVSLKELKSGAFKLYGLQNNSRRRHEAEYRGSSERNRVVEARNHFDTNEARAREGESGRI